MRLVETLVVITEWDAFPALDPARVKAARRDPVVVDLRSTYPRETMSALGFRYQGIGRDAG